MNKFVINRFFILFFVIFSLLILWLFLILFYNPYVPFSVLRYEQSSYDKIDGKKGELLAGEKVEGEFKARDNFLGIVNFNFNIFNRTNLDTIVFRIKEKNSKKWYAVNKYKVDRFKNGFNYPFGFPTIKHSKNRTYIFQMESINGKSGDSIGINQNYPFLSTNYVFPKSYYFNDKNYFIDFLVKKYINLFTNPLFYPIILIYLFPLIFYLLLPISKKREYTKRYVLFFPLLILILLDKFFVDKLVDLITFELQLFWIILIIIYKWESSVTFFFSLIFILLMPILVILNKLEIAEKIAIQTYFFLIIAVTQLGIENKLNLKNRISHKIFLISILDNIKLIKKLK